MVSDPHAGHIYRTFKEAIDILDKSEVGVRDMIENGLMDIAGVNGTKVKTAVSSAKNLAQQITAHRMVHIKAAFRHLRDNLPSDL